MIYRRDFAQQTRPKILINRRHRALSITAGETHKDARGRHPTMISLSLSLVPSGEGSR